MIMRILFWETAEQSRSTLGIVAQWKNKVGLCPDTLCKEMSVSSYKWWALGTRRKKGKVTDNKEQEKSFYLATLLSESHDLKY